MARVQFKSHLSHNFFQLNYWQHCAQCNVPVFKLLRGQFWGFSPHRCNDKGTGLQKWNFYWDLIKMWNTKRPIPCAIFTKFAELVPKRAFFIVAVCMQIPFCSRNVIKPNDSAQQVRQTFAGHACDNTLAYRNSFLHACWCNFHCKSLQNVRDLQTQQSSMLCAATLSRFL